METTVDQVLDRLKEMFPDGIIYEEEYNKLGVSAVTYKIHNLSKAAGQTRVQWLSAQGYTWKAVGYVEPDMRPRNVEIPSDPKDAFTLADGIFKKYPLAGEYVLTNQEAEMLYQSASHSVQKILRKSSDITMQEKVVLVLETIELLKNCSDDPTGEGDENDSFWNNIFLQYGVQSEHSKAAWNRLYSNFRAAIEYTLECRYKRFFAPTGTKRYYTTLFLHALAPQRSIEGLFNILFNFYVENLDFQYVPEDTSYKLFTKGMRARWNSSVTIQDHLQLRSDMVFSGLKTLFNERPGYMAVLCDSIVEKMDALLRGEDQDRLDPSRNGWDQLLVRWYQKKSGSERSRVQGKRREKKSEFVATTKERISIRYFLENDMVGLNVPCIRLQEITGQEIGDYRPELYVLQNGAQIYRGKLSVMGNDLCLTTKSLFLPLEKTAYDFEAPPKLQAKIEFGNELLYNSGQRLERDYLIFDASGSERAVKTGRVFLFTGNKSDVDFSQEDSVLLLSHPGQLFRLDLSEISSVAVDGREAFAGVKASVQFRCHTVPGPMKNLHGLGNSGALDLFPKPFLLSLVLPDGENPLLYQLSLDDKRHNLKDFQREDRTLFIRSASESGRTHSIKVIDIRTGLIRYEYCYAILPDCVLRLDKPLYRSGVDESQMTFSWGGQNAQMTLPASEEDDTIEVSLPDLDFALEVKIPLLRCVLLGKNGFCAPEILWHKDIPANEFTLIRPPEDWTCRLTLGTQEIPAPDGVHFELGNELRARRDFRETEPLSLSLSKGQEFIKYKLTEIAFVPRFLQPPLELEQEALFWQGADTYVGDVGAHFTVELDLPDGTTRIFQTSAEQDQELEAPFACPDGRYNYRVRLKSVSVFSAETAVELYQGELLVGDVNSFRFQDREIHVREALCWDFEQEALKQVKMREGCGIICNLTYQGVNIPPWEEIPMPHYTATLYFEDTWGRRWTFNSSPKSKGFELVNPVHIWLVNERLLILLCHDEDGSGVYIDTRYNTIVNRSLDDSVPKREQKKILDTPDYFEYIVKEASPNV